MTDLAERLSFLKQRLRNAYDGIGHSHGRPYIYFVYPPEKERELRRLITLDLQNDSALTFYRLDILSIIMQTTSGNEARREELLNDPKNGRNAKVSLLRVWSRAVARAISIHLETTVQDARPVAVLYGLAALHPLTTPTGMMEGMAEEEPRDPTTGRIVPIVLLIPGVRPPQTSREYLFLGEESLRKSFYRGEEI